MDVWYPRCVLRTTTTTAKHLSNAQVCAHTTAIRCKYAELYRIYEFCYPEYWRYGLMSPPPRRFTCNLILHAHVRLVSFGFSRSMSKFTRTTASEYIMRCWRSLDRMYDDAPNRVDDQTKVKFLLFFICETLLIYLLQFCRCHSLHER